MATSSITANFSCSGTRAANTLVDLLLSETPPAKWTAPAPAGIAHTCATKREIRNAVHRIIRARRSMAHA